MCTCWDLDKSSFRHFFVNEICTSGHSLKGRTILCLILTAMLERRFVRCVKNNEQRNVRMENCPWFVPVPSSPASWRWFSRSGAHPAPAADASGAPSPEIATFYTWENILGFFDIFIKKDNSWGLLHQYSVRNPTIMHWSVLKGLFTYTAVNS